MIELDEFVDEEDEDQHEIGGESDDPDTETFAEELPYPGTHIKRDPNPELPPDTVTLLHTNEGGIVYLVGTAHFSESSQEDVAKVNIGLARLQLKVYNFNISTTLD